MCLVSIDSLLKLDSLCHSIGVTKYLAENVITVLTRNVPAVAVTSTITAVRSNRTLPGSIGP